jgi:hypothetical protein
VSTSHGTGAAHPVTAATGPPMTPEQELAQARDDAAHAARIVEQVRAKLERAATDADRADARQALDGAEAEAAAAREKAERLSDGTGG